MAINGTRKHETGAKRRRWGARLASNPLAPRSPASRPFASVLLALGVALPVLAWSGEARADFRVCNETRETVGVSLGYKSTEDGWISEGWWHVPGEECQTVVSGALTARYYYLYAENAERSRRWGGEARMCTAEEEFRIVGVAECVPRGYARMGFGEYDTGEQTSWTVRLTADGASPSEAASVAAPAATR